MKNEKTGLAPKTNERSRTNQMKEQNRNYEYVRCTHNVDDKQWKTVLNQMIFHLI